MGTDRFLPRVNRSRSALVNLLPCPHGQHGRVSVVEHGDLALCGCRHERSAWSDARPPSADAQAGPQPATESRSRESSPPASSSARSRSRRCWDSDGVLDTSGPEDRFGPDRLQRALTGADTADEAVNSVRCALDDFEVGTQADDTVALAVEWLGLREAVAESGEDQDASSQPITP